MSLKDFYNYTFKEEPTEEFCEKLPKALYPFYLKRIFENKLGYKLNLKNPKTFSEKIQWLKLNDSTQMKSDLADKIKVRNYVEEKIGKEYLKKVYGIYNKFDEIKFNELPEYFVLKANTGWKTNVYYKKSISLPELDAKIKLHFDDFIKKKWAFASGFEMHYDGIEPKIFAEELITKIKHYEVLCFNGEPKYICIKYFQDKNFYISWYNTDFQLENFKLEYDFGGTAEIDIDKAKEVIELSKKLSDSFKLVRCDFEISNNSKIYFEEMTFTPYSGFRNFEPKEYNYILGDMIKLENN